MQHAIMDLVPICSTQMFWLDLLQIGQRLDMEHFNNEKEI